MVAVLEARDEFGSKADFPHFRLWHQLYSFCVSHRSGLSLDQSVSDQFLVRIFHRTDLIRLISRFSTELLTSEKLIWSWHSDFRDSLTVIMNAAGSDQSLFAELSDLATADTYDCQCR